MTPRRAREIKQRLGLGLDMVSAGPAARGSPERLLGILYLGGVGLSVSSMVVPQPPGTHMAGLWAIYAVGGLAGIVLLGFSSRLPAGTWHGALVLATGLITASMLAVPGRTGVYAMFYVWVSVTAFTFGARRAGLAHLVLIGALYATVLDSETTPGAAEQWLITMGTVAGAGLLVSVLRRRVLVLIGTLSDAARTDPLTSILNRRGFEEAFELELERSRRSERPVALISIDIDHFKALNDREGHAAGDEALVRFAELLRDSCRRIDICSRIGGEEFAVILPETDERGALLVAERIRHRIRTTLDGGPDALTASLGVASFPRDGAGADAVMRAADQALYAAKQLGRDRTAVYRPEILAGLMGDADRRQQRGESQLTALIMLAEGLDARDPSTAGHGERVAELARLTARRLGFDAEHCERVRLAGLLHDVGKVGVDERLLATPGPLSPEQWTEVRRHAELGARIAAGAGLPDVARWIGAHHERPDGRGYPAGLQGEELSLEAAVIAVADAYETMISGRPYRSALDAAAAQRELERCAGTQFDPRAVQAFLEALEARERDPLTRRR